MASRVEKLIKELRSLAKGPGLRDERLDTRIGPELRRLSRVTEHDTCAATRRKLAAWVTYTIRDQPEQHMTVVRAALGLHRDASHDNLQGRVDWLAGELNVGKRTVERRIKQALEQLARDGVANELSAAAAIDVGHVVIEHQALSRMDLHPPEFTEQCGIEVTEESLATIVRRVSIPCGTNATDPVDCEVLDGGWLRRIERDPDMPERVFCHIDPGRTLSIGEPHKFRIRYKVPNPRPLFAVQPLTPYNMIRYRVQFPPDRQPRVVWRLDGVTAWDLANGVPAGDVLPSSPSGLYEVHCIGLRIGLVYGLRWEW